MTDQRVRVVVPGRVNLIGEHTDHAGGVALPMAIDLATTITGVRQPDSHEVRLRSWDQPQPSGPVMIPLGGADPSTVHPAWGRYVAGVVTELAPSVGFDGDVHTTLPIGAGLSSSASLELAVALALGAPGDPRELAELGQRAEHRATGVPCGLMDQLAIASGIDGHALLIDFTSFTVEPVPIPSDAVIVVVHSGETRHLVDSAYADRRAACDAASTAIGSLHDATIADVATIGDATTRRRAHHVVTENARVRRFVAALADGNLATAGRLMRESHASLRDDFEVSTPDVDALVARLQAQDGVYGCRLTGGGFGGCVVALCAPGAIHEGWTVHPSAGPSVTLLAD